MARLFWPYRGRGPMQKRGWPDPNGQVYAGPLTLRLGRVVTARFARLHSAAQTKCQRCVEHVCQRCVETAHGPALPFLLGLFSSPLAKDFVEEHGAGIADV